ncbi:MAG TPA: hypothetical protein ENN34_09815 [Deltaproteobacteria bacterium]|nr:hypothetical protein [Deltaproteobacteria bacterium]
MDKTLRSLITPQKLRKLAGERSYGRGVDYQENGHVWKIVTRTHSISAKVSGTQTYRVKIWYDKRLDDLDYFCSCPVGEDGDFCKHLVAAGLEWISEKSDGDNRYTSPAVDIPQWLAGLEKERLINIILDHADEHDEFYDWLELQVTISPAHGKLDLSRIKKLLKQAITIRGFVDYANTYEYSLRVENAIESLAQLLEADYAREVVELAEYAVTRLETFLHNINDSDDFMSDIVSNLAELHHEACRQARPDPKALARRLFVWETTSDWDFFRDSGNIYADVLGEKGLREYRRLIEREWKKVPILSPDMDRTHFDHKRNRITAMITSLAQHEGDKDLLLEIKKRDLSQPHNFLEIAKIHLETGKIDQAISWARQGLTAFPDSRGEQLVDFLVETHLEQGDHEEALDLAWKNFCKRPSMDRFSILKSAVHTSSSWPSWREKAIAHVRKVLKEQLSQKKSYAWQYTPDSSLLVEMLLSESNTEAAWQEALATGCSRSLWMRLARLRAKNHPEDFLRVYQQEIELTLRHTNTDAYQRAVDLLEKISGPMIETKGKHAFTAYVATIREANKRRRNFIALLDRKEWV